MNTSCVGIWKQDRAEIVTNEWGNTKTPSYVSFTDKGRLIGDAAKYRASINPYDTVFNFKRLLGRKFSSPDVQDHINKFPFEVVERNDIPFVRVSHCGSTKDFVRIAYPQNF